MNTPTTDTITDDKEKIMHTIFYTLHDFMVHTKDITYLIMGGLLIALPLFWVFLTGKDEKGKTY